MQERKIRLIWDFRGPEALKIAEHHCVHLEEFALKANLDYQPCAVMEYSELYSIAFITVNERDMLVFRDALKPHRGEVSR
ncbi:MAG: hypothetical protein U5K51_02165 [Flavobacteriaceae bacterium]|nr:hypothetical protein [Flavobacteriaceae bacterium]